MKQDSEAPLRIDRKERQGPLVMSTMGSRGVVVVWAQVFTIPWGIVRYRG